MANKDFTLVIQGALNKVSISNIDNYLKYVDKIIISYWDNDDESLLAPILGNEKIQLVKNDPTQIAGKLYNQQNVGYQCISSLRGLQYVTTEFSIKSRADESFEDLSKFTQSILDNPNDITTTNLFFLPDSVTKFHPSDHLLGGDTKTLIQIYSYMYDLIAKDKFSLYNLGQFPLPCSDYEIILGNAETIMAFCLCKTKGMLFDSSESKFITNDLFKIINIKDLAPVKWTSNAYGYKSVSDLDIDKLIPFKIANSNEEI